tara:strand:- start:695 stop:994 length:300 start_codon:yes stop_codon:yes gene_type:complete
MKKQPTKNYSKMSKKELEIFARDYGLELDKRLKKATLVRMVEIAVEKHNKKPTKLTPPPSQLIKEGQNPNLPIKKSYYGKLVILTVIIAVGLLILKNCI